MTACRISPPAGIVPMNVRAHAHDPTRSPPCGYVCPDGRAATPPPARKYDRIVHTRLARFAWGVLAYNIAVILWGAFVRASGSGAGCGSHWPLCNGEVLPREPRIETIIELTHRVTSGIALLLVVGLVVMAYRHRPKGHPAHRAAVLTLIFMLTEAAVGAGLVLFELVADNQSMARAMFMATHLINTFFLLGAMTLTAHFASGRAPFRLRGQGSLAGWLMAGAAT